MASLVGRLSEAEQINPVYKIQRLRIMSKYRPEWNEVMQARIRKSKANMRARKVS